MDSNPLAGASQPKRRTAPPTDAAQIQQRLLQLGSQLETLQAQVDRVTVGLGQESAQLAQLVQYLTTTVQEDDPIGERLVEFTEQMSADHEQLIFVSRKLTELATQEQLVRLATLVATQQQVMELAETVRELGRTQQRAIDLEESRSQQVRAVLDTLQAALLGRTHIEERQQEAEQNRQETIRRHARGEFAADFLPALDGLEAVLEDGRLLLARQRQELGDAGPAPHDPRSAPPSGSLVNRLRSRLAGEAEGESGMGLAAPGPEAARALGGWLKALALVRDRFIALMVQEGIQPIPTLRQRFDPQVHLAIQGEVRSDVPPDTIVRELRKGYRQGKRVLRYAEVVVARAPQSGQPD